MKRISIIIATTILISSCGDTKNKTIAQQEIIDHSSFNITEVVGMGKVEPEGKIINLAAISGGIVNRVYKTDGDNVIAGEKLVQLENKTELLKIAEIERQMISQHSQINIEKNNIREVEWKMDNKRKLLITTQSLVDKGAETQQVYDDLSTEVNTLEVSLEKAKLNVLLAENKLLEIDQQLNSLKEEDRKTLYAPADGRILSMNAAEGTALNQYAEFAEFAPAGELIVRAEIDELFSQKLQVGQQVNIRFAGSQEVVESGNIKALSPYLKKKSLFSERASDQEDRRVREIKISIKGNTDLIINAKVECVVKL